jgi:hypothetical protein
MPTVLRVRRFRFHFYSDEGNEPPHIHVRAPEGECKFWLVPIELAKNRGLALHVLSEIEDIINEHHAYLVERYHEFHNR